MHACGVDASVFMCAHVGASVFMCAHAGVCACLCLCVYVCVSVCVRVHARAFVCVQGGEVCVPEQFKDKYTITKLIKPLALAAELVRKGVYLHVSRNRRQSIILLFTLGLIS